MKEIFANIEGFDNYRVSTKGNVYSISRDIILKPWITYDGYRQIRLCNKSNHKAFKIGRLAALVYLPNPENKPCVNHIDGNKLNDNLTNLEWATYSENTKHSFRLGLQSNLGENHSQHKITEDIVIDIRKTNATGKYNLRTLSDIFGLSRSHLSAIINKKYWKHV